MDRSLVLDERTKTVAWRITQYLKATDRFAKTIVFCEDVDHAERMRQALILWNGDEVVKNHKYVMRITGDDSVGKARFGEQARAVMQALLDKYADQGIEAIESPDALKIVPFPQIGTPVEIVRAFGGRNQFQSALRDLKKRLYVA